MRRLHSIAQQRRHQQQHRSHTRVRLARATLQAQMGDPQQAVSGATDALVPALASCWDNHFCMCTAYADA